MASLTVNSPGHLVLNHHGFVPDYLLSPIHKGLGHLLLDNCIVASFFDLGQQCHSFFFKAVLGLSSRIGVTEIYFCLSGFFNIVGRLALICRFVLDN